MKVSTLISFVTLLAAQGISAQSCAPPLRSLCCMGSNVSPWFTNQAVWGGICGYNPTNPNELIGGRCIPKTGSTCPGLTYSACCTGLWPGQCALGTGCGASSPPPTTTSSTAPTFPTPSPVPAGWTTVSECAVDNASRLFTSTTTTILSNNTPANCIAHCSAQGWRYAGVENGNECHCGAGYKSGVSPASVSINECTKACTGDANQRCGGSWRIQVYASTTPPPTEQYPTGWSPLYDCAIDDGARIITGAISVQNLSNNTPAICAAHCDENGYTVSGVEYGAECICGNGVRAEIQAAATTECGIPCAGNNSLFCGGSWRIQVYSKAS